MNPLNRSFFERPTLTVAQELLGKMLVIGECSGRINEVEAYIGQNDPACHARSGKTQRNKSMFGPAGHLYVYFTYGMHYCANIVTEKEGFPAAILIRSIQPLTGIELMQQRRDKTNNLTNGPAKLCQALGIARESHDGMDLCNEGEGYIANDETRIPSFKTSPRIGIRKGLGKLWRFYYT